MNHPDEGVLQAFLDGQLAVEERARIARHTGDCALCTAELEELRSAAGLFSRSVRLLDESVPELSAVRARIEAAAPARPRPRLRLLPESHTRVREVRRAFLRAAVLVLMVAGAASAAIPGGAVRRFLAAIWHQTTRLFGVSQPARPATATAPRSVAPAPPAPPAGVSVLPYDGQVRIQVTAPAPGLRVRVRVVESDRASVEASGGASSAHFNIGPGRIEVSGGGTGEMRIALPRAAQHVTLEIAGKPVLSKDGAEMRFFAPAQHVGTETVFQSPP